MNKISVILVDDNKTFREAFRIILSRYENIEIVGEAENGIQAIELLDDLVPDLVFMDIQMPVMNGFEATKRMLWKFKSIKFIAVTSFREETYMLNILEAGFKGCIYKDKIYEELDDALYQVMDNQYFFSKEVRVNYFNK